MSIIEKYKINALNSIQTNLTYRFQFFTGVFLLIIPFILKNCLWKLAFVSSGTSSINGYTYNELFVYNILAMIFAYLNSTYFQYIISAEVMDGSLSRYLVKPIDHMFYWVSMLVGDKIINIVYTLVFVIILALLFGTQIGAYIIFYNIPFMIIALFFSIILNFILFYLISLLSFWLLEISAFFSAVTFIISVMSGEVIPIDIMPVFVEKILTYLPFSYSVYFPVQIIMGELTMQEMFLKFALQIIWIVVIGIISRFVWNAGVRKYESVGG